METSPFLSEDALKPKEVKEETPFVVNIEEDSKKYRKEGFWYEGDVIDGKIIAGKEVILPEEDRLRLKALVEGTGADLTKIEGPTDLKQQAKGLVDALGLDRANKLVEEVVVELLDAPEGNVDNSISHEDVRIFLEGYLNSKVRIEKDWQREAWYRMEAVISVTNKLMWILAAEDEQEAIRRQNTPGILKYLRERVLRGYENAGDSLPNGLERYVKEEGEKKEISHLPKGGVGVILEHLTRK
jgi:hypothetical protein